MSPVACGCLALFVCPAGFFSWPQTESRSGGSLDAVSGCIAVRAPAGKERRPHLSRCKWSQTRRERPYPVWNSRISLCWTTTSPARFSPFKPSGEARKRPVRRFEVILLVDTVNEPFQQVSITRQQIANFLLQNGGHLAAPVSLFVLTNQGVDAQRRPTYDGNGLAQDIRQLDNHLRTITRSAGFWGADERFQLSLQALHNIADNEAKKPGRKLLIWAGPGWPLFDTPRIESTYKEQQQDFDALVQLSTRLREARISVYSVSLGQPNLGTFLYQDFLKGVRSQRR